MSNVCLQFVPCMQQNIWVYHVQYRKIPSQWRVSVRVMPGDAVYRMYQLLKTYVLFVVQVCAFADECDWLYEKCTA
jgi:hypothetical protein